MDEMSRSEASKIWENLTIADNFIFQKVMRKKRLCKRFIEKILHIKIRKIMFPETEKGINIRRDSKFSAQTSLHEISQSRCAFGLRSWDFIVRA